MVDSVKIETSKGKGILLSSFPLETQDILTIFDADGDGQVNMAELAIAAKMYKRTAQESKKRGWGLIVAVVLICLLVGSNFATSWVAVETSKDTSMTGSALTPKGSDEIVSTHQATVALPLWVAPALDKARLGDISSLSFTQKVLGDDGAADVATVVMAIKRVNKFSDSHIEFIGEGSTVVVKDGLAHASYTGSDGQKVQEELCEADVSCAALTVDSAAELEKLERIATEALPSEAEGRRLGPSGKGNCGGGRRRRSSGSTTEETVSIDFGLVG